MRRMLLVLMVAAMMAVMVALASPAFAAPAWCGVSGTAEPPNPHASAACPPHP